MTHLVDENLSLTQFRQFRQLVGHYCSFLLPKQVDRKFKFQVNWRFSLLMFPFHLVIVSDCNIKYPWFRSYNGVPPVRLAKICTVDGISQLSHRARHRRERSRQTSARRHGERSGERAVYSFTNVRRTGGPQGDSE